MYIGQGHSPSRLGSLLNGLVSTYLYGMPRSSRAIQHLWVNGQNWGVVSIGRDGGGRPYPTAVEDELGVGLVGTDGLFCEAGCAGMELKDVGCHGSTGGSGAALGD